MTRWLTISVLMTLAVLAACVFLTLLRPDLLRERIPTHWGIDMQPDAWTGRDDFYKIALLLPGMMATMIVLMVVLPLVSPKAFEVERFADTWGYVLTVLVAFFGYLSALVLWAAVADSPCWSKWFVAGFFALLAVLGNVMGKVRRNFWMGVRTPWTLASEAVWEGTHRHAAWLWVAAGVLGGAAVVLGLPFWIGLVTIVAAALWPVVYSLLLYKRLERQGRL